MFWFLVQLQFIPRRQERPIGASAPCNCPSPTHFPDHLLRAESMNTLLDCTTEDRWTDGRMDGRHNKSGWKHFCFYTLLAAKHLLRNQVQRKELGWSLRRDVRF